MRGILKQSVQSKTIFALVLETYKAESVIEVNGSLAILRFDVESFSIL